ncbi:MAG: UbiA prenyltransferase family protein [Nanoarchaeota archaeon]
MKDLIYLARPHQWYKNLVVFIAIFFSGQFFNLDAVILTALGFFSLCLVSSANYVINDILDRNEDKKHPEKKSRPLASGKVRVLHAITMAAVLLSFSVIIAYYLGSQFLVSVLALFFLTLFYSAELKNEAVLDVIIIGANFVLRAIAGAFIIKVAISPWLIVCTFFLALLLACSKRRGELNLKEKNPRIKDYTHIVEPLIYSNAAILIMAYVLYSFTQHPPLFMLTLPVFVYGVFTFLLITKKYPKIARKPHLLILNQRMFTAGTIMLVIMLGVLYV